MTKHLKSNYLEQQEILFCIVLTILVLFNFSLTALRIYHSQQLYFLFLVWNLFLALLPWLGAKTAHYLQKIGASPFLIILFLVATIVFLPNAPYLLTDLCHLRWTTYANFLWLDILMIVAYAATGLVVFYATFFVLEKILEQYWGATWTTLVLILLFFLNAFGVYLGRFLRFNSWDLVTKPWSLLEVITERLMYPMAHPKTWGVTLGYGSLFLLGFYGLKLWKYSLLSSQKSASIPLSTKT